nr:7TM diverse intracellular signaling domain-containing protein [Ramlibacter agri]
MLAAAAHAQGVLESGTADQHRLGPYVAYLEDPGGRLQLDDILQPAQQARFRPDQGNGPAANFGLTRAAIWLRIRIAAAPGSDPGWLLELAYPPLDHLQLYSPDGQGGWRRQVGGDLEPFASRPIAHRNHVLPVLLPAGATSTLYLRLESEGTVAAPLRLWRPAALWRSDQASYAALALYFGLLAGLLLYNLLLFVSVRDTAYLVYVLFVAGMALALAALTGLGYQFLWPRQVWWNSVSPPAGFCFAAVFGLLFARRFLDSAEGMPVIDRLLLALAAAWGLTLVPLLVLPYVVSNWLVTLLAPISVIVLVTSGVLALRRGHAGARHYLAAWALLLAGVLVLSLHNTGIVPSNAFTANALLIGSALELVLLSFALADRINVARRFREQAQIKLAAEQAMVSALSDSRERLRTVLDEREVILSEREAILNNAVVGIVLSVKRRHVWVNEKFAHMLGYAREALVGRLSDYIHPDRESWERFGVEARSALLATNNYAWELQLRRSDGGLFWVEMGGSCIRANDPDAGVIWTFLDITERKKSEAEIREALEQQKALNALRTRFVAMTSHEFRTPLAAILSAEELLRHYGERLPSQERRETLDNIAQGVQRMSRMVDRVLLLGRADARMLEFRPAEVNLQALCAQLVEEARLQHPEAKATVRCEMAPDLGRGRYDEKLLRHALGNLLSNALKYSPEGGEVLFAIARDNGDTVFRVRDAGIGIPETELAHLFESFHRAGNVGTIPGTGLGLAIVKNAVEMHGGTIAVASRQGEGTVFTVRLPASEPRRPT